MPELPDRSDGDDKPYPENDTHRPAHGDTMRDVIPPRPYEPGRDYAEEPPRTGDMDRPEMDVDE
jgi:hypothetical protein